MRTAMNALYYGAAAASAIAGMLHLMLGPGNLGFNVNQGILFIVGGIAQVFWIIPLIRRWGKVWYGVGIAGTAVLMALFFITRVQGNPITGRGGGVNSMSIAVEVFQGIFIGLAAAIIVFESGKKRAERETPSEAVVKKSRKHVPILAGVVIALVLAGVFVLPMTMPRPMGGTPGQGGPQGIGQAGGPGTGNGGPTEQSQQIGTIATNQTCTLTPSIIEVESTPQQTEGPYFVDEKLDRSDIRSDPFDGSVQEGIPLTLVLHVYDIDNGTCIPLKGAQVDIWHANALGVYSDVQQLGTSGKKFLRGYQVTDGNGTVGFNTIYPGWYEGRAVHIHFKIRTFEGTNETLEFTSQFFMNDTISDQVYSQSLYSQHGTRDTRNNQDGIFNGASTDGVLQSRAGEHVILNLTKQDQGYIGTFNIGLKLNQPGGQ